MGSRRRLISTALLWASVAAVCSTSSCKPKDNAPPKDDKPLDRLARNEVVEGKESAFGLPLPRVAKIQARFDKSIHVTTPLTPEDLTNFVRARVKEGKITPGTNGTQLVNVIPRDDQKKTLTIDVRTVISGNGTKSEMIVRDTTGPVPEPGLSDEDRWKKAGFTPSGKVLDPKTLQ